MFLDAGDDEGGEGETGPGDGEVPDGDGLEAGHTDGPRPQHQLAGPAVEQLQQLRGLQADLSAGLEEELLSEREVTERRDLPGESGERAGSTH